MPIGVGVGRNSATAAAMRARKKPSPTLFTVNLQCNLPEDSERLFEQILAEKKGRLAGGGDKWQERLCILTTNKLVLSKIGSGEALDVIPLSEVVDVSHVDSLRRSDEDVCRQAQDAMDHLNAFYVHTAEGGLCAGRNYCFRAATDEACQEWIAKLRQAAGSAKARAEMEANGTGLQYWRTRCGKMYTSRPAQMFFCMVIISAFLVSVISSEVQPEEGTAAYKSFAALQTSFTVAFALELCFNAFGSVSHSFFKDSWNVFDTIVVAVSVLAETLEGFPAFSMIRLIRVFRVVRVLRWMTSLRQILIALMSAIMPVINSFLILLLVTCIYAVLATELFKQDSEEYFGSFSLSLFTMFQIATGDAWASIVGRSLRMEDGSLHVWAVLFLVSYVLVVGLVLINIVIAVLLDEFLSTVAQEKESSRHEEQGQMRCQMGMVESPLEPLLESIGNFFSNEDLSARIQYIFKLLDTDGNQSLSCSELNHGLRKLDFHPPIHLSADDFEVMTEGKRLCNQDGELDQQMFEVMMRSQLQHHVQMKAATAMVTADSVSKSLLFVLKQMALTLELISPVSQGPDSPDEAEKDSDDGSEPDQMHAPRSFYVGHSLRSVVKLPMGLGYGRSSRAKLGSFSKSRRWKGYYNSNAGRSWSPMRTSPAPEALVSPKRLGVGRSRSFNLNNTSSPLAKALSHSSKLSPSPSHSASLRRAASADGGQQARLSEDGVGSESARPTLVSATSATAGTEGADRHVSGLQRRVDAALPPPINIIALPEAIAQVEPAAQGLRAGLERQPSRTGAAATAEAHGTSSLDRTPTGRSGDANPPTLENRVAVSGMGVPLLQLSSRRAHSHHSDATAPVSLRP